MTFDDITARDLEFNVIREVLKGFARTTGGREYFDTIKFFDDIENIEREYSYISEAINIINNNEDIDLEGVTDIRGFIDRIRKGGVISGSEIMEIKNLISIIRQFRSFIRAKREEYPFIYQRTAPLDGYDELFSSISKVLDDRGVIRDDCSERLTDLRIEAKRVRERILNIIDDFFKNPDTSKLLMDSYYSIRNNRYVIPVKTQFKNSIKGIIHGSSNTNETLFIEPESIINLDNELVYIESMISREEEKILIDLCGRINQFSDQLLRDYDIILFLDIIFAKARYSLRIGGNRLQTGKYLDLIDIKHPLLVLKQVEVVPNALKLEDKVRGVVISGPNAGGKTVFLKSVGLALLHLKLGLFFTASDRSVIIPFNNIFTCFGDAQNIEEGLSTFSGHIKRLKEILERCKENDLILLDEIASDTDPKEGSALSAAIIDKMIEKGAYVFVTTHFHELRQWAATKDYVINAAMGFDPVNFKPTYRLIPGASGESYTLRIAKDMGIPDEIIENANQILGREYREYAEMTNILKNKEREVLLKLKELEDLKTTKEKEYKDLMENKEKEFQKRIAELNEKYNSLIAELQSYLDKISHEISRIQKESDMKRAVSLQREVKEVLNNKRICESGYEDVEFRVGDYVSIGNIRSCGQIMEMDSKKGRALININGKNIWVDLRDLRLTEKREIKETSSLNKSVPAELNKYTGDVVDYEKVVDVRGMFLDEAISEVERELDHAYQKSYSRVRIIHGHGTGSLKTGIRRYLRESAYVSAFRPAGLQDGGDGVTIVEIKKD